MGTAFLAPKLGTRFIHGNCFFSPQVKDAYYSWELLFSPQVRDAFYSRELFNSLFFRDIYLATFGMWWPESKLYQKPKLMCFTLLQKYHWNLCLSIILFLPMWVYFHSKLVAFLCKHVRVFALNTVLILYFKT